MDTSPVAAFLTSTDTKFYLALLGAAWAARGGFNWIKDFREKDVKGIKEDLSAQTGVIHSGFTALTSGIQELRNDFRTFYTSPDPLMIPVNARTTRKRKSVAERSRVKERGGKARKPAAVKKAAK